MIDRRRCANPTASSRRIPCRRSRRDRGATARREDRGRIRIEDALESSYSAHGERDCFLSGGRICERSSGDSNRANPGSAWFICHRTVRSPDPRRVLKASEIFIGGFLKCAHMSCQHIASKEPRSKNKSGKRRSGGYVKVESRTMGLAHVRHRRIRFTNSLASSQLWRRRGRSPHGRGRSAMSRNGSRTEWAGSAHGESRAKG